MQFNRLVVLFVVLLAISFTGCAGSSSKLPEEGRITYSPRYKGVPDGAIHPRGKFFRSEPPSHFFKPGRTKILFWFQTATYKPTKQRRQAQVIVDYMEVIEDHYGRRRVIYREDYSGSTRRLGLYEGGLFTRFPKWFANNNNNPIQDSLIHGGFLKIKVPYSGIIHWWTPRLKYRKGAKYYVKIRIKIVGVGFQIGADYWDGDKPHNGWDSDCWGKNNCEFGVSKWYGDTDGEFKIIKFPD